MFTHVSVLATDMFPTTVYLLLEVFSLSEHHKRERARFSRAPARTSLFVCSLGAHRNLDKGSALDVSSPPENPFSRLVVGFIASPPLLQALGDSGRCHSFL